MGKGHIPLHEGERPFVQFGAVQTRSKEKIVSVFEVDKRTKRIFHLTKILVSKSMARPGVKVLAVIADTRGARGVIVIVVGNGHGDTNSNPGRD